MKTVKELLSKIKGEWKDGKRATRWTRFANGISLRYAHKLGFTQQEVLNALENKRNYSAANYYQSANFPRIAGKVVVFATEEDFRKCFPSHKYRCPRCGGISTDPQKCNSGVKVARKTRDDIGPCDWKAYGLFRALDGGYRFIIKETFLDQCRVYDIFKPIELVASSNG